MICTEAALDHNTGIDAATTEAAHDNLTQPTEDTATDPTETHCTDYIADHPHLTTSQVTDPKILVGHIHDHPTDLQGMNHADEILTPAEQEGGYTPRRT